MSIHQSGTAADYFGHCPVLLRFCARCLQRVPVMDDFFMCHDHWKGLANLEFEASLGELEDDVGGQISFVRGAIVRPIQHKHTLSWAWPASALVISLYGLTQ